MLPNVLLGALIHRILNTVFRGLGEIPPRWTIPSLMTEQGGRCLENTGSPTRSWGGAKPSQRAWARHWAQQVRPEWQPAEWAERCGALIESGWDESVWLPVTHSPGLLWVRVPWRIVCCPVNPSTPPLSFVFQDYLNIGMGMPQTSFGVQGLWQA